jgi:glycosyltransferase involved in cell wall biosynthesis
MQAADAYVQPSRLEGLSNATMEAMAVGLPVVTTNAGGQSELVRNGENGGLVPTCDPAALYQAMDEVVRRADLATARGAAARQTIVERFDARWEAARLSGRLVRLYAETAARRTGVAQVTREMAFAPDSPLRTRRTGGRESGLL